MFYSSLASLICCASFPLPPLLGPRDKVVVAQFSIVFLWFCCCFSFFFWSFWPEAKGCGKSVMHAASGPKQTAIHTTLSHTHTQIAALFLGMLPFRPLLAHALLLLLFSCLRFKGLNHINEFSFGHVFCACSAALIMQN